MKAVMWELEWGQYEQPSNGLWKPKREVEVLCETNRAIKIKKHWWNKPKWFGKNCIGIRFDKIEITMKEPKEAASDDRV